MSDQAKRWTVGLAVSLPWLLIPGWNLFQEEHGAARWWGAVLICSLALLVLIAPAVESIVGLRALLVVIAAQVVVALAMALVAPPAAAGMLVYPAVVSAALVPSRRVFGLVVALALLSMSVPLWAPGGAGAFGADGNPSWMQGLLVLALGAWMVGFSQNIRNNEELKRTRGLLADAAVAAERERIAHDLHDILGHSLTAISVQASVVRRMAERSEGDHDLATHARAIEDQARAALADVRATAAGIRDTSLAGELAIARQTLNAVGIDADLPNAIDHVAPAGRAVFGYVLREAVTNVVRHSNARRCTVRISERAIEVRDDGRPDAEAILPGTPVKSADEAKGIGLSGLTWRLKAVGGTITYGPGVSGGFVVRAEVPEGARIDSDASSPEAAVS